MKQKKLTKRQLDVMKILWASEGPMTVSSIKKSNPSLNINTVRSAVQTLLKNEYIEIADIVYSGTVLSRSYKPIISAEEYISDNFSDIHGLFSSPAFLAHFIEQENNPDVIRQLEKKIQKRKQELEKEN